MSRVKANNDKYTKILMQRLRGQSKRAMSFTVQAVYRVAMAKTIQDSGRAAYNWRLKIGAGTAFEAGDWYRAPHPDGTFVGATSRTAKRSNRHAIQPGHPVGHAGERRGPGHKKVINHQLAAHGMPSGTRYDQNDFAQKVGATTVFRGGKAGGTGGGVTTVVLYNPMFDISKFPDYAMNAFEPHGNSFDQKLKRAADKAMTRFAAEEATRKQ